MHTETVTRRRPQALTGRRRRCRILGSMSKRGPSRNKAAIGDLRRSTSNAAPLALRKATDAPCGPRRPDPSRRPTSMAATRPSGACTRVACSRRGRRRRGRNPHRQAAATVEKWKAPSSGRGNIGREAGPRVRDSRNCGLMALDVALGHQDGRRHPCSGRRRRFLGPRKFSPPPNAPSEAQRERTACGAARLQCLPRLTLCRACETMRPE
jgi:hypothetical protein